MNPRERGFLLLSSHLGNPDRRPLTTAQLRILAQRVQNAPKPGGNRELEPRDLMALGYGDDMARRITALLKEEELLDHYLRRGRQHGCVPVTRVSGEYPPVLRSRLGLDSPGCLWIKGDPAILNTPAIALVGSRDISEVNRKFAEEVGRQAARQGYTLISGNARGADRAAQRACLQEGGRVISIVADELAKQPLSERILYVSEDGFDAVFSAQRALSRNRCIHALGRKTFVAQCGYQYGGTWDGTAKNLCSGWSPVFCFADGSPAAGLLTQMGAEGIDLEDLRGLDALISGEKSLFDLAP